MATARRTYPVALVALLAAGAHASQAPVSPWAGFGVGSWVVVHTKTTGPEQSTEQRLKMIIVRKRKGWPEVGVAQQIGGQFESRFRTGRQVIGFGPSQLGMKLVDSKAGHHVIDGERHACTVETHRVNDRKRRVARTLKLWQAKDVQVPYREIIVDRGANVALGANVVKAVYEVRSGESTTSYELEVTKLDDPVLVGGERLPCTVEQGTARTEQGAERRVVQTQRWLSARIPGHVVKLEGSFKVDGAEFRKMQHVESFQVKPDP